MYKVLMQNILFLCLLFLVKFNKAIGQIENKISPILKKEIELVSRYECNVKGGEVDTLQIAILLLNTIEERQTVNSIEYSIQPDSIVYDGEYSYAIFNIRKAHKKIKFSITTNLTLYSNFYKDKIDTTVDLSQYLTDVKCIKVHTPQIETIAKYLQKETDFETVMNTIKLAKDSFKVVNKRLGGDSMINKHRTCNDFGDLIVALLRANNLPAKVMVGFRVAKESNFNLNYEVFLKNIGWVAFNYWDIDLPIVKDGNGYYVSKNNEYIILYKRNEELYTQSENIGYYYSREYGRKGKPTFYIKSEYNVYEN